MKTFSISALVAVGVIGVGLPLAQARATSVRIQDLKIVDETSKPVLVASANDHHGDNHHGDNHHGDNHHGDNHHGDNHHGDNHHGDNHHGDNHHGDNHHGGFHGRTDLAPTGGDLPSPQSI
jgi:hypothetical protein